MIEIKKLLVEQKDFCLDLENIRIEKGDKIAILGKNGSGKTTFIESLFQLRKVKKYKVIKKIKLRKNAVFQNANYNEKLKNY